MDRLKWFFVWNWTYAHSSVMTPNSFSNPFYLRIRFHQFVAAWINILLFILNVTLSQRRKWRSTCSSWSIETFLKLTSKRCGIWTQWRPSKPLILMSKNESDIKLMKPISLMCMVNQVEFLLHLPPKYHKRFSNTINMSPMGFLRPCLSKTDWFQTELAF